MEEFVDCGERVLQLSRAYGRLKGSDLEVSREIDAVWTIRDGRVARFEVFLNRAKALKAARLDAKSAFENLDEADT